MAINLSSLTSSATTATALGNVVLITPSRNNIYKPQISYAVDGVQAEFVEEEFLFQYEGDNVVNFSADITDHFVEDNRSLQDHIAFRPVQITVQGFIGELTNAAPNRYFRYGQIAAENLYALSAYTPSLSTTALQAYNNAFFAYQTFQSVKNSAISAYNIGSKIAGENVEPLQNKQQEFFNKFVAYYTNRYLFTVQTPWRQFENMAIMNIRALQTAETRVISDFEITFKQINLAKTKRVRVESDYTNKSGRARAQSQTPVDNGVSTPPLASLSISEVIGGLA